MTALNVSEISRANIHKARNVAKTTVELIDSILYGKINMGDEFGMDIIANNRDVVYHMALWLARLNVIADHTTHEVMCAIKEGVGFSEKDANMDLANGKDAKNSNSLQKEIRVSKTTGKETTYYHWNIYVKNKIGDILFKANHKGRDFIATIPHSVYNGKLSIRVTADENGVPRGTYAKYFEGS
jgi:hypothetical protein